MTLTVSPQIRLVALLGGVAALGLAAFMLMAGRGSGSSSTPVKTIKPLHPVRKLGTHGPPSQQTVAKSRPASRTTAKAKTSPKVTPKPKAPPAKAAPKPIELAAGLPPVLQNALRRHAVVVVSLFDPQAKVDGISLAEASAGAAVAHAGFVPLNVLDQRQAGPLTNVLGVLPDPAVLVYRRPGDVVARFDGFADRDTVAQAVANAATATS